MNPEQRERYSRHILLPEIGMEGQEKLLQAKVLIVGAGGLGCPVALYLAAAGVGCIGIIDFDKVDATNLQRQILYTTADIGQSKVQVAKQRIQSLNPDIQVDTFQDALGNGNALQLFSQYNLVIDGTDNFATRYLVNDACVLTQTPNVYGSIYRFEGQVTLFATQDGPCYRCLFPEPPKPGEVPNCAEGGVLGVLPGIIGIAQATEAIKWITGQGTSLQNRLLIYDAMEMAWKELRIKPDPNCPICGTNPTLTQLSDYQAFCGTPLPTQPTTMSDEIQQLPATEAHAMLTSDNPPFLLDVRLPDEIRVAKIEGAHNIPLQEIAARHEELEHLKGKPIILHCHKGMRSLRAASFLAEKGYTQLYNLQGGIEAWSLDVDSSVPRY
jgi:molybdopterin/thiamine biosynthesis adenylyltransferase/rhodanese-related sulfurtransferase